MKNLWKTICFFYEPAIVKFLFIFFIWLSSGAVIYFIEFDRGHWITFSLGGIIAFLFCLMSFRALIGNDTHLKQCWAATMFLCMLGVFCRALVNPWWFIVFTPFGVMLLVSLIRKIVRNSWA